MVPTPDAQLGLFGESTGGGAMAPALDWPAEIRRLAGQFAGWPLYLGTSSWAFPGWSGLVYPAAVAAGSRLAAEGLRWYSQHPLLRTVGIDRSYYGPLTAGDYRAYADQVPAAFAFVAKADRRLTTPPEQLPAGAGRDAAYLDAKRLADGCLAPLLAGLGAGRAGLLLQFPPLRPRERRDPGRFIDSLARLVDDWPAGVQGYVELRNGELLTPAYFDLLRRTGLAHCYSVHPGAPPLADQARLAGEQGDGPLLIRWNLQRNRVYEDARAEFAPFNRLAAPDVATRAEAVILASTALRAGRTVTVLANNKAEGSAPLTLVEFARELAAVLPVAGRVMPGGGPARREPRPAP